MEQPKRRYYDELNIFRALIIIWVTVGHSFDRGADFTGFLHSYAYCFHMQAFFILSGLLFGGKIKRIASVKDAAAAVKERFIRLMVPYLFLTLVSFLLKLAMQPYAYHKLRKEDLLYSLIGICNPNGGLWFLYTLFVLSLLAILLYRLPFWAGFLLSVGLYTVHTVTGITDWAVMTYVGEYCMFFFFGLVLSQGYKNISDAATNAVKKHPIPWTAAVLLLLAVSVAVANAKINLYPRSSAVSLAAAVLMIAVYYLLAVVLCQLAPVKRALSVIGNYGMDIYLIGYYVQITLRVVLMSLLALPYPVYSSAMLLFGLLLPIPISALFVRKFRITSLLILGSYKKEVKNDVKKA